MSNVQRELEAKQPEYEALQAAGIEFLERANKFEIHSQADYEEALRLRAEAVAHKQLIQEKFAPLIDAIELSCHRLLTQERRLLV